MASREMRRLKKKQQEEGKKEKSRTAVNTFSVVIILLIAFGFLFSFFPGTFLPSTRINFGSYAGKDIIWENDNFFGRTVLSDYNNEDETLKARLQEAKTSQEKDQIEKQIKALTVPAVIQNDYQKIVFHIAILAEAARSGVMVSDKRNQQTIADFYRPELLKIDNIKQRENKFLDFYNKQKDYFNESLVDLQYNYDRRALLMPPSISTFQSRYNWDFSRLLSSPKETEYVAQIGRQQRKFDFVLFNYDDYPVPEILKYVNSDPAHRDKFRTIDLSRILFTGGKEEAQKLRTDIINGTVSYEEKADKVKKTDEYAEDVVEKYTYYYYELEDIIKDKADAVLQLKTGELSQPIQIDEKGNEWIIYRCEKEMSQPDFSIPKMQQAVKAYLKFKEMSIIQNYFENKAKELKSSGTRLGFTEACRTMGVPVYTTDSFSLNYEALSFIDSKISEREDIKKLVEPALENQDFFLKAFSLKQNQISDPVLLEKSIVVLHLTQVKELSPEEYDKLKTAYDNYKGFIAFTDLHTLLVKDDKLDNRMQEGLAAYQKLMESLPR
jgi:hypothetical protein